MGKGVKDQGVPRIHVPSMVFETSILTRVRVGHEFTASGVRNSGCRRASRTITGGTPDGKRFPVQRTHWKGMKSAATRAVLAWVYRVQTSGTEISMAGLYNSDHYAIRME